jgi:hypothetical protein
VYTYLCRLERKSLAARQRGEDHGCPTGSAGTIGLQTGKIHEHSRCTTCVQLCKGKGLCFSPALGHRVFMPVIRKMVMPCKARLT